MLKLKDRREAGIKLAAKLEKYRNTKPLILGMPRGGVVVAYEIAKALHALLDVIVARKIGAPGQPEFAVGAIAPGDVVVWNDEIRLYFAVDEKAVANIISQEQAEMQRRIQLYRGRDAADLETIVPGKSVIVVDDGIATGQSALAAVRSLRKLNPAKIVLAVGVAAADSLAMLQREVDEVICLAIPEPFHAVGLWYDDFAQVGDAEVIALLQQNHKETM